MMIQDEQDYQDDQDKKQENTYAHAHIGRKAESRPARPDHPGAAKLSAFLVFRDRFPFGSPEELDVVHAASIRDARLAAKLRWPRALLLVTEAPRKRSASSQAYRDFLAKKRNARRLAPSQTLTRGEP